METVLSSSKGPRERGKELQTGAASKSTRNRFTDLVTLHATGRSLRLAEFLRNDDRPRKVQTFFPKMDRKILAG